MKPERWRQISMLFQAALKRAPGVRAAYLKEVCAADDSLRREVESLLEAHDQGEQLIDAPAIEAAAPLLAEGGEKLSAGDSLGYYKVVEQIGAGGMGEVYLAEDARLGRKVALKLLPSFFTKDKERLRRFQLEARAASALNHPNVLTVYEIGESAGKHFIATEFIDGVVLRQRMSAATAVPVRDAVEIALQIASALAAAHDARIIHRDIKPENIMIRRDGYVKVLDFGLAKLSENLDETKKNQSDASTRALIRTASGVIMGTVLYMSPEQARGQDVDSRTDIWSLGVVLYEMLTGRAPFEGETQSHVVVKILDEEPPPLASQTKAMPVELERIVLKALRKPREERYQTVGEMISALRQLKQRMEIEAALQDSDSSEQRTEMFDQASAATEVAVTNEERRTPTAQTEAATTVVTSEPAISERKRFKWSSPAALVAIALAIALLSFGVYKLTHRRQTGSSTAFAKTKLTKLTTSGKASFAAISPDGKYVAHVSGDRGKQSIVLKHVATGSDQEIVPVTGDDYWSLAFSHDGNYIYYRRAEKDQAVLYRVPVLGGLAPARLVEDINSAVTLSPDDQHLAFVRGYPAEGTSAIIIANTDGTGEQKFLVRKGGDLFPFGIATASFGPAWSPDGEMIAFQVRGATPSAGGSHLEVVQIRDKAERTLTNQKWTGIGQISWLADGSGLIMNAAEDSSGAFQQVWHVAYPTGEARKITNDLNNYFGVSLTMDSSTLVTMQGEQLSNIWIAPDGDAKRAVKITSGKTDGDDGISWTPDGRIVYLSSATGDQDIWTMNADGSDQKQLTRSARRSSASIVSPDGRYIVFASTRTGERRIWRIDIDGGNPKQLTSGSNDVYPYFTPDGRWVVYVGTDSGMPMLWKVPIDGGTPVQITDYYAYKPSISPDGKWIAALFLDEQSNPKRNYASIIPFDGGKPTVAFDFPMSRMRYVWTPDSRSLIYIKEHAGVSNLWSQPINGGKPVQITDFNSDHIYWFDWSRDHRQLACARGTQTSDVVLINDLK